MVRNMMVSGKVTATVSSPSGTLWEWAKLNGMTTPSAGESGLQRAKS
jgi:hypothetical protein